MQYAKAALRLRKACRAVNAEIRHRNTTTILDTLVRTGLMYVLCA